MIFLKWTDGKCHEKINLCAPDNCLSGNLSNLFKKSLGPWQMPSPFPCKGLFLNHVKLLKVKNPDGPLDNQTWPKEWKTAPLAKVQSCQYKKRLEAFVVQQSFVQKGKIFVLMLILTLIPWSTKHYNTFCVDSEKSSIKVYDCHRMSWVHTVNTKRNKLPQVYSQGEQKWAGPRVSRQLPSLWMPSLCLLLGLLKCSVACWGLVEEAVEPW